MRAIQRVLQREKENYEKDDPFRRPGQHPGMGYHLVSDGYIVIVLGTLLKNVPVGSCMDSLAGMVFKECDRGCHIPLADAEVNPELWTRLQSDKGYDLGAVELTASTEDGQVVCGEFSPRCLLDALDAVGDDACFYLGYGGMSQKRLTLLVAPPDGSKSNGALIARVLALEP